MLDTLDIMTRTLRLARQSMLKTSRMQSYKSRSLQFPTIVSVKGKHPGNISVAYKETLKSSEKAY
jgi:hypothetical protein